MTTICFEQQSKCAEVNKNDNKEIISKGELLYNLFPFTSNIFPALSTNNYVGSGLREIRTMAFCEKSCNDSGYYPVFSFSSVTRVYVRYVLYILCVCWGQGKWRKFENCKLTINC